jgi:hypothetical protein
MYVSVRVSACVHVRVHMSKSVHICVLVLCMQVPSMHAWRGLKARLQFAVMWLHCRLTNTHFEGLLNSGSACYVMLCPATFCHIVFFFLRASLKPGNLVLQSEMCITLTPTVSP